MSLNRIALSSFLKLLRRQDMCGSANCKPTPLVIPANAGIQRLQQRHWIPASAGMTTPYRTSGSKNTQRAAG